MTERAQTIKMAFAALELKDPVHVEDCERGNLLISYQGREFAGQLHEALVWVCAQVMGRGDLLEMAELYASQRVLHDGLRESGVTEVAVSVDDILQLRAEAAERGRPCS